MDVREPRVAQVRVPLWQLRARLPGADDGQLLHRVAVGKNPDGTYYSYKTLTCPQCGKSSKARVLKRVDAQDAKGSGRLLK